MCAPAPALPTESRTAPAPTRSPCRRRASPAPRCLAGSPSRSSFDSRTTFTQLCSASSESSILHSKVPWRAVSRIQSLVVAAALGSACDCGPSDLGSKVFACSSDGECADGFACVGKVCTRSGGAGGGSTGGGSDGGVGDGGVG